MLAIAGPGREASEKSNLGSIEAAALSSAGLGIFDAAALSSAGLGFIEAAALPSAGLGLIEVAALPSAGCQCLCLPDGPTKHQVLSWLSVALSSGPCTSSSQILQQLHVHQAIENRIYLQRRAENQYKPYF